MAESKPHTRNFCFVFYLTSVSSRLLVVTVYAKKKKKKILSPYPPPTPAFPTFPVSCHLRNESWDRNQAQCHRQNEKVCF